MSDAISTLLFKFRSETHGLNEDLGKQRGRAGKVDCICVVLSVRVCCGNGVLMVVVIGGKECQKSLFACQKHM